MEKKEGKYPVNVRVSVDYSKGKPNIKFGYPRKPTDKEVIRQNAGTGIFLFPIVFFLVILPYLFLLIPYSWDGEVLTNCSSEFNYYPENMFNGSLNNLTIICDENIYQVEYYNIPEQSNLEKLIYGEEISFRQEIFEDEKEGYIALIKLILVIILIISMMIISFKLDKLLAKYYTKWEWYQKLQPRFQAWRLGGSKRRAYYVKFKKEDIKNNQIEIPLFKNVKLEYKTNGDFSDKLLRLEIMEHDFLEKVIFKKKPDKKSMKQVWLWKTIFTFKEIPKDGYLEVWFK